MPDVCPEMADVPVLHAVVKNNKLVKQMIFFHTIPFVLFVFNPYIMISYRLPHCQPSVSIPIHRRFRGSSNNIVRLLLPALPCAKIACFAWATTPATHNTVAALQP